MAGGFALLAAADFNAEEGVADGFNSSVMLWDAGGGGGGGGESEGGGPLRSLHDSLTAGVFKCLMRWDHWVEMVVRFIGRPPRVPHPVYTAPVYPTPTGTTRAAALRTRRASTPDAPSFTPSALLAAGAPGHDSAREVPGHVRRL